MPSRVKPPTDPVHIEHDGERLTAQRGESLASALLAHDRVLLARSPKLHRPRGPYCLRGACDGCLARVDGVPNVMTCLRPVSGGERVETQNVVGVRELDLMGATDFLFPRGLDHHKLFAGVRGVSAIVQRFARRVAGLGVLPSRAGEVHEARHEEADVLIVGSGRAACRVAREHETERVVHVDDATVAGGRAALIEPSWRSDPTLAQVRTLTTVLSLSREPEPGLWALLLGPEGLTLLCVREVVLATGRHDPVLPFQNNDLPGTFSARAALALVRAGLALGRRVAVVGSGPLGDALCLTPGTEWLRVAPETLRGAAGRRRVSAIFTERGGKTERRSVDALVIDGPGAPAFELAVQAGGSVVHAPHGFLPQADSSGRVAPSVRCVGSVVGSG